MERQFDLDDFQKRDYNHENLDPIEDGIGVYDHLAPLLGYTTNANQCLLKIFSIKSDKTLHILRFSSSIIKF
jgi:hypothetical protein